MKIEIYIHETVELAKTALEEGDPEKCVTLLRAAHCVCEDLDKLRAIDQAIQEAEGGSVQRAETLLTLI